jgi:hypothetical protein
LKSRQLIVLSVASVLSISIYFIGYKFKANLRISDLFWHPLYSLEFVASYLSMPFGGMKSAQFGVGLGLVSLCTVTVLGFLAARKGLLYSTAGIVLFFPHRSSHRSRKNGCNRPWLLWGKTAEILNCSSRYVGGVRVAWSLVIFEVSLESSVFWSDNVPSRFAPTSGTSKAEMVAASTRR